MMGEGYKKELELEDLFEARKEDESEFLGSKLERFIPCSVLSQLIPDISGTGTQSWREWREAEERRKELSTSLVLLKQY